MSFATAIPHGTSRLHPAPRVLLQRKCRCGGNAPAGGECEECRKKKLLQRRSRACDSAAGQMAPPLVHEVVQSPGQALDAATRATMEHRLGHGLGDVRIHTDGRAGASADAVQAHAYTVGRHVVFGAGEYRPQSSAGRELLAHELVHTIQQRGVATTPSPGELRLGSPDSTQEREARAVSTSLNEPVSSLSSIAPTIQRRTWDDLPVYYERPEIANKRAPVQSKDEAKSCEVKSEGTLSQTSWGETGGLYPTSSAKGIYDPSKWDCTKLEELLRCRAAIHAVCKRGQSCHSSSPPKKDSFAQSIARYHYAENFPAVDSVIADDPGVKWFFLSHDENADHTGITGETKVKSYGPFYNVGGGDVPKGMTYVIFYKVPAKK